MSTSDRRTLTPLHGLLALASLPSPFANAYIIRRAAPHELPRVAELQLDTFAAIDETPALVPMLASLYAQNQRRARSELLRRLLIQVTQRCDDGSDMFIAIDPEDDASAGIIRSGAYAEPGAPILGTVDLSQRELVLPTHSISEGLYMSCMAVAPKARRRGVARALLKATEKRARERGASILWLHVEPGNEVAMRLYERAGFCRQPDSRCFRDFTRALNLDGPYLYSKALLQGTHSKTFGSS